MSAEDEVRFQLSNNYLICNKLFDVGNNKGRDHCHITGKYRDSTHWDCNINFRLTKKVPIIFHNLWGSASKFDLKVNVIPNEL